MLLVPPQRFLYMGNATFYTADAEGLRWSGLLMLALEHIVWRSLLLTHHSGSAPRNKESKQ